MWHMVSARTGRPPRETKAVRLTLVLDEHSMKRLDGMRDEFARRWGVAPTYAVLVKRALAFAERDAVEAPPELERLEVARLQFQRLSAAAASARGRERLFPLLGELVGLLQRTNQLRHAIAARRKDWKEWSIAHAQAGELMMHVGQLQDRVAEAMNRR